MTSASAIPPHVAESFARQGLMRSLGARLVEAADGRCVVEAPYRDSIGQQHGFFHGGAVASLADAAAGHAALSLASAGSDVLTAEFKISFLRPARGALVRADARVLKFGRALATVSARVWVEGDGEPAHCAELLGSMSLRIAGAEPH